jgi:hypothetical protein
MTRLIVVLSLIGLLMMGDIADAVSFMDFLKAIGNSISHPQKKSQSRTKSTKQPDGPTNITCAQHWPLQKLKAQKPIFHTPFPFLENRGSSPARSRPTQVISMSTSFRPERT